MKITLKQFNRIIKEAAAKKSGETPALKVEDDNPPMPVIPALYEADPDDDIKKLSEAVLRDLRLAQQVLRKS